ncbi:hypothetical protein BDN67DRAFT_870788, partial [Paxillus ammoniavirescens]
YRPTTAKEYFNYQHALLHNVIERIISVVKHHFHILVVPLNAQWKYKPASPALCCLHNIIHEWDPQEL